ncbi:zinc-finger-containing protein [Robbsia andropogonis]|uniref:zinc-finger-containing protein n=1 Tax=Robbsia andropogonis TaxID=28092 RepID=UPI002445D547|nr:zinc-finger-containing protein [Robbsia andropogonis]
MRVGRPIKAPTSVKCDYCGEPAMLRKFGDDGYPYSVDRKPVWICVPCQAWVPVRAGKENKPAGRLANTELREAKQAVHAALEPFVERKMARDGANVFEARGKALRWAAAAAGIEEEKTNFHTLSLDESLRISAFIGEYLERRAQQK